MTERKVAVDQLKCGSYQNFVYLVYDQETLDALIIDPAWDVQRFLQILKEKKLVLDYIINTHAHFDHIEGNQKLSKETGAKIIMNEHSMARKDKTAADGEVLHVSENLGIRFIHTPGHSPESMCIIVNDLGIFTGDTLFVGECGRTDLPGGNSEDLYSSFEKLRRLNPNLKVFPGHDYGPKQVSTLDEQFATNYTLAKMTKQEFVKFMREP